MISELQFGQVSFVMFSLLPQTDKATEIVFHINLLLDTSVSPSINIVKYNIKYFNFIFYYFNNLVIIIRHNR